MTEVFGLMERGGPTMYAIAAVAALGIGLFIERFLTTYRIVSDTQRLSRRMRDAATAGDMPTLMALSSEAGHGLARILGRGGELAMRGAGRDDILDMMIRQARRHTMKLRRGLGLMAALGTMAPFLGLLGTVLGIMQALRDIGDNGGAGFNVVSVGVAEALITTATGIVVAVVIVLLHQILRWKLGTAVLEIQILVEESAEHFERGRAAQNAASEGGVDEPTT